MGFAVVAMQILESKHFHWGFNGFGGRGDATAGKQLFPMVFQWFPMVSPHAFRRGAERAWKPPAPLWAPKKQTDG